MVEGQEPVAAQSTTVYAAIVRESSDQARQHHSAVQIYTALLTALIAGVASVFVSGNGAASLVVGILGSGLGIYVAQTAVTFTFREYQLWLQIITMRAKLEQNLGLTVGGCMASRPDYWGKEPVVFPGHFASRTDYSESSRLWVEIRSRQGNQRVAELLFRAYQVAFAVIGILSLGGLVYRTLVSLVRFAC